MVLLASMTFAFAATIAGCEQSASENEPQTGAAADDELSPEVRALLASFPPLTVEPEMLDFGEVLPANPVTKSVKLTNTTDEPLRITESRSNCGCTTPDMSGVVIEPNASTDVPIHFDAEGRTGDRSATVTIVVEGYDRPIRLNVRAFVIEES